MDDIAWTFYKSYKDLPECIFSFLADFPCVSVFSVYIFQSWTASVRTFALCCWPVVTWSHTKVINLHFNLPWPWHRHWHSQVVLTYLLYIQGKPFTKVTCTHTQRKREETLNSMGQKERKRSSETVFKISFYPLLNHIVSHNKHVIPSQGCQMFLYCWWEVLCVSYIQQFAPLISALHVHCTWRVQAGSPQPFTSTRDQEAFDKHDTDTLNKQ